MKTTQKKMLVGILSACLSIVIAILALAFIFAPKIDKMHSESNVDDQLYAQTDPVKESVSTSYAPRASYQAKTPAPLYSDEDGYWYDAATFDGTDTYHLQGSQSLQISFSSAGIFDFAIKVDNFGTDWTGIEVYVDYYEFDGLIYENFQWYAQDDITYDYEENNNVFSTYDEINLEERPINWEQSLWYHFSANIPQYSDYACIVFSSDSTDLDMSIKLLDCVNVKAEAEGSGKIQYKNTSDKSLDMSWEKGVKQTLTAIPDSDNFVYWTNSKNAIVGSGTTLEVATSANETYTAHFCDYSATGFTLKNDSKGQYLYVKDSQATVTYKFVGEKYLNFQYDYTQSLIRVSFIVTIDGKDYIKFAGSQGKSTFTGNWQNVSCFAQGSGEHTVIIKYNFKSSGECGIKDMALRTPEEMEHDGLMTTATIDFDERLASMAITDGINNPEPISSGEFKIAKYRYVSFTATKNKNVPSKLLPDEYETILFESWNYGGESKDVNYADKAQESVSSYSVCFDGTNIFEKEPYPGASGTTDIVQLDVRSIAPLGDIYLMITNERNEVVQQDDGTGNMADSVIIKNDESLTANFGEIRNYTFMVPTVETLSCGDKSLQGSIVVEYDDENNISNVFSKKAVTAEDKDGYDYYVFTNDGSSGEINIRFTRKIDGYLDSNTDPSGGSKSNDFNFYIKFQPAEGDVKISDIIDDQSKDNVSITAQSPDPWVIDYVNSEVGNYAFKPSNISSSAASTSSLSIKTEKKGILYFKCFFVNTNSTSSACVKFNSTKLIQGGNSTYPSIVKNDWVIGQNGKNITTYFECSIPVEQGKTNTLSISLNKLTGTAGNSGFAIWDVKFFEEKTIDVAHRASEIDGKTFGTTSVSGNAKSGSTLTFTAAPNDGSVFYGWVDNSTGELLSKEKVFSFTIIYEEKLDFTAVMAPEGTYVARCSGNFYTTLAEALQQTTKNKSEIYVLKDCTLPSGEYTLNAGVALILPYDDEGHYEGTGSWTDYSSKLIGSGLSWESTNQNIKDPQYTLTVEEGATLNICGTLRVGGVLGFPDHVPQGLTSGRYSKVVLDGDVIVKSGGTFDVRGLVVGKGHIDVQADVANGAVTASGALYQPFLILDFNGGTNAYATFNDNLTPFKMYTMLNIQLEKGYTINYGGILYGHASLHTGSGYTTTDQAFISYEGAKRLMMAPILLKANAKADVLYDNGHKRIGYEGTGKTPEEGYRISNLGSVGQTTVTITGGATSGYMEISIVDTKNVYFAVPFNYSYVLKNGDYAINYLLKFMPGSSLTVEESAALTVNEGAGLHVYDSFLMPYLDLRTYPTSKNLTDAQYNPYATLIVNGTLTLKSGSHFVGTVQNTNGKGKINVENNVTLREELHDGVATVYTCNYTEYTLVAQIWNKVTQELVPLQSGNSYEATDGNAAFALPGIVFKIESNVEHTKSTAHKLTSATTPQADGLLGSWRLVHSEHQCDLTLHEDDTLPTEQNPVITFTRHCTVMGCEEEVTRKLVYIPQASPHVSYTGNPLTDEEIRAGIKQLYALHAANFDLFETVSGDLSFTPFTNVSALGYEVTLTLSDAYFVKERNCVTSVTFTVFVDKAALTDENVEISLTEETYTGDPITKQITVTYNGKTLIKDSDYSVAYSENTNVGTAVITITGTGSNFTGTVTKKFAIIARSLADAEVVWSSGDKVYTGEKIQPTVTSVTVNSRALKSVTDYTVEYGTNTDHGIGTVTIKGIGNYTGEKQLTFTINPKNMSQAKVNVSGTYVYNGKAQQPQVAVSLEGFDKSLVIGDDYDIMYSPDGLVEAGTVEVTVNFKGNYTGSAKGEFVIQQKDITSLEFGGVEVSYEYTGSAVYPEVTVTFGEEKLVLNKDFDVKYGNNTTVAQGGSVTVVGKGNFRGTKIINFSIVAKQVNSAAVSVAECVYNTKAQQPAVTVDGYSNTDYDLSWSNNINAGSEAVVTLTFKGNYSGKVEQKFTISPASTQSVRIQFERDGYTYNGSEHKPTVTVTLGDVVLTSQDVTVEITDNVSAGNANITVKFGSNFTGEQRTDSFVISPASLTLEVFEQQAVYNAELRQPQSRKGTDYTLDGVFNDDDVLVEFTVDNARDVGKYEIHAALTGTKANNYKLAQSNFEEKFEITPAQIDRIEVTNPKVTYTGKQIEPGIKVYAGQLEVPANNLEVTVSNNINVGQANIHAAASGNFSGELDTEFQIVAADVSNASVTLSDAGKQFVYNKQAHMPDVTVTHNSFTFDAQKDYKISYTNNINAGVATVRVEFNGNFSGSKEISFTITPKSLTVQLFKQDVVYNGKAQSAASSSDKYSIEGLESGDSITLQLSSVAIVDVGYADITAIQQGDETTLKNYSIIDNMLKLSNGFEITALDITDKNATVTVSGEYVYNGKQQQPINSNISVKVDEMDVTFDTVDYGCNVNVSEGGSVTVHAVGNFTGTASGTFVITKAGVTVKADDKHSPAGEKQVALTAKVSVGELYDDGNTILSSCITFSLSRDVESAPEGTHIVITVTYQDDGTAANSNYEVTTAPGDYTITPAVFGNISVQEITTTYDGEKHEVTVSGTPDGSKVTITYLKGEVESDPIDVGVYTAKINISCQIEGNDYSTEITSSVTINKKAASIKLNKQSKEYNGTTLSVDTDGKWSWGDEVLEKDKQQLSVTLAGTGRNVDLYRITATVSGAKAGNYDFTASLILENGFEITAKNAELKIYDQSAIYTGSMLHVQNGREYYSLTGIVSNDNLTVTLQANLTDVGHTEIDAVVGGTHARNYNVTVTKGTFTVKPMTATGVATVSVNESFFYDGEQKMPLPTVAVNAKVLEKDKDYTLEYENNIDAGFAAVKVLFKGNYTGEASKEFEIGRRSAKVIIEGTYSVVYNGHAQSAESASNWKFDNVLDGDISGLKVVLVGTGTDVGNYSISAVVSGEKVHNYNFETQDGERAFVITPAQITEVEIVGSYIYSGSEQTVQVNVWAGELKPELGEYRIIYADKSDRINVGTVKFTVEGLHNYGGKVESQFNIKAKQVQNPVITVDVATYTGVEVSPTVSVNLDGKQLKSGIDFTTTFKNNVNAGSDAEVTLTFQNNYKGTATKKFTIDPKNAALIVETQQLVYNGSLQNAANNYSFEGITEGDRNGLFATVKGTGKDVGQYDVTVTVEGDKASNYNFEIRKNDGALVIVPAQIDSLQIVSNHIYNGTEQTPDIVVKAGTLTVNADDYDVSYGQDRINAGSVQVTVTVKENKNFTGTLNESFTIAKAAITGAVANGVYIYDRSEQSVKLTVTAQNNLTLTDNDYIVTYNGNRTDVGNVTVTVTANAESNFTGSTVASFEIIAAEVTQVTVNESELVYDGTAKKITLTVKAEDLILREGEYTLNDNRGGDMINAGDITFTVSGKDNFAGQASVTVSIAKASITDVTVSGSYVYNGEAQRVTFTVKAGALTPGSTDYTVEYKGNLTDAGTVELVVNGIGNYQGSATASFVIAKATITVSVADKQSVYGDAFEQLTFSYTGLLEKDADSVDLDNYVTLVCSAITERNVGSYSILATQHDTDSLSNYNLQIVNNGTYTVTKRTLTVTVNDQNAVYDPEGNYAFDVNGWRITEGRLASGESNSVLNVVLTKPEITNAGSYEITAAYTNSNYEVTIVKGNYNVSKLNLPDNDQTVFELYIDGDYFDPDKIYTYSGTALELTAHVYYLLSPETEIGVKVDPSSIAEAGYITVTVTVEDPNYSGERTYTVTVVGEDGLTPRLKEVLESLEALCGDLTIDTLSSTEENFTKLKQAQSLIDSLTEEEKESGVETLAPYTELLQAWNRASELDEGVISTAKAIADAPLKGLLAAVNALLAAVYAALKGGIRK